MEDRAGVLPLGTTSVIPCWLRLTHSPFTGGRVAWHRGISPCSDTARCVSLSQTLSLSDLQVVHRGKEAHT